MDIHQIMQYDEMQDLEIKDESEPQNKGSYTIRDISYSNSLGGRVSAYYIKPNTEGIHKAIVFVHWLETHAENSNRLEFLPLAEKFAVKGYASILMDCYWSTTPTEWNKDPKLWWNSDLDHDVELCRRQLIDLKRTIDVLIQDPDIDHDHMVLGAHDFGAMYSMTLSSVYNKFKAYAFMAMTSKYGHWFKFGSKLTPEEFRIYEEKMSFLDPIKHISNIKSPTLYQFSTNDFYVPKNIAEEIYNTANSKKELKWYDAGHGLNDQAFDDMFNWLDKHL